MPVITARFAVSTTLLALIVLALPGIPIWLWVCNLVLIAVAVMDFFRTPDPRRLAVHRDLPLRTQIDAQERVRWSVSAPLSGPGAQRSTRVVLADELVPSLRPDTRRPELRVPAAGTAHSATTIRPARRGRFTPAAVTVRTYGPWGMAARQRTVDVAGRMMVLPSFPSRQRAELLIADARRVESGERTVRRRGAGGTFDSLRKYTVDDDYRRIDWAATARARAPVVRTYRAEQNQTVLVLLDTGRTMAARVGDVPRLDFAMDAGMALTMVATRLGDQAGLVAFDEEVRAVVPARGRNEQLGVVSEAMAGLDPRLVEADYRSAFVSTLSRFRRRALVVVLTDLAPGAVEHTLLPALPLITRTHEVIVAGVADPTVAGWAVGRPNEAETAFRAAAAAQELRAKRDVSADLQRAGARVVDTPGADLAGAVCQAYLGLKWSGRL